MSVKAIARALATVLAVILVTTLVAGCGGGEGDVRGDQDAAGPARAGTKTALADAPPASTALTDEQALRYIASYGDLIAAFGPDANAGRAHHASRAAIEQRSILFDPLTYTANYRDLIAAFGTDTLAATRHFIVDGHREGRSDRFDALRYIASYGDLITAYGADASTGARHFIAYGVGEGRSPRFDAATYLAKYADLQAAFGQDLVAGARHFIVDGYREGRSDTPAAAASRTPGLDHPILFVTQVPTQADFAARGSTFANHLGGIANVARGGDLWIRYPDGRLRNLTAEAGHGTAGQQGANAIAVREPSVHWEGTKAVFSMVVGAPTARYQLTSHVWQLYEVSGLGVNDKAVITRVAGQPAGYNNVSPLYGTNDRILFTSDRPRNGAAHLYPQLDEYESTATVTGLWSINPAAPDGDLKLLNHAVSGAFSPFIDSAGRVVFTRWDHLQQDQQADADRAAPAAPPNGSFNLSSEAADATPLASRSEFFPESRLGQASAYGPVNGHTFNFFTPWQINEDGTEEETLNHVGRQELSFGYLPRSFANDGALSDNTNDALHANRKSVRMDGGLFHLREEPARPGSYLGIAAREFGSLSTHQIVRLSGAPTLNAERMTLTDVTPPDTGAGLPGGRFRNPIGLVSGTVLASHTPTSVADPSQITQILLKPLVANAATGLQAAGESITGGLRKAVTWWDPDTLRSFDGPLWELEATEVVARPRPQRPGAALEPPEAQVLADAQVDEAALRRWMRDRDLALIVTRDQTSRDRADLQQPFNLRVPGGRQTLSPRGGRSYDISHFQIVQADQLRAYRFRGRRPIAQAMNDAAAVASNPSNPGGPTGSVRIAADGSTAAFVPARRALAWQTTDANGEPVVRERVWISFQPGEVRVCASCHGVNQLNQAGQAAPAQPPQALRDLLTHWKALTR